MEGIDSWTAEMQAALDDLKVRLSTTDLPRLERAIGLYRANYDHLYGLLVRKSLIKEDRYGYDSSPARITVPPDDEILEAQRHDQASIRLAAYRAQLEFLATKADLSLDKLTLGAVRRMSELLRYIQWERIADGSDSPITRCVGDFIKRIKAANDAMAAQLAAATVGQLDRTAREILATLERVAALQREAYKGRLRAEVLPAAGAGKTAEETLERVRRHFAAALKGRQLYPELLQEVLAEDSPEGGEARSGALARLTSLAAGPLPRSTQGDREALLQALRALSMAAHPLADSVAKMAANDLATRAAPERRGLRGLLRRILHAPEQRPPHEIEYLDGAVMRSEKIDLDGFLDEVTRQARLLAALGRPESQASAKIQRAPEKSLAEFVDRQAAALQVTYRRLAGLSELFRRRAQTEAAVKGIKIELTLLKNCLIRSSRLRRQHDGAAAPSDKDARPRK